MNPKTKDTPNAEGSNFVSVLIQMRRGQTVADLSDSITTLVQRVRETRKKGSVTLKITIAPQSRGDDVVLSITDDVSTKLPVAERGSSIFFAADDNTLVRNDPRQSELVLTVVPTVPAAAQRVG